jgi:hypothetical protein
MKEEKLKHINELVKMSNNFGVGKVDNLSFFFAEHSEFINLSYTASCNKLNRWKTLTSTIKKKKSSLKSVVYSNLANALKVLINTTNPQDMLKVNIDDVRAMLQIEFARNHSANLFFLCHYGPSWSQKFAAKYQLPSQIFSIAHSSFNKEQKNSDRSVDKKLLDEIELQGKVYIDFKQFKFLPTQTSYIDPESFRRKVWTVGSDFMGEYNVNIFIEHHNVEDVHCCVFLEQDLVTNIVNYFVQDLSIRGISILSMYQDNQFYCHNLSKSNECCTIICRDNKCPKCITELNFNDYIRFYQTIDLKNNSIIEHLDNQNSELIQLKFVKFVSLELNKLGILNSPNNQESSVPMQNICQSPVSTNSSTTCNVTPKWGSLKLGHSAQVDMYFKPKCIYTIGKEFSCDIRTPDISTVGLKHCKVFLVYIENIPTVYVESCSKYKTYIFSSETNSSSIAQLNFGERFILKSRMVISVQPVLKKQFRIVFTRTEQDLSDSLLNNK